MPPPPVSPTVRDVSNQNTYNPLAKKRRGIPPWIIPALLVLLAIAIGIWRSVPRSAESAAAPATVKPTTTPVREAAPTPTPGDLTATSIAVTLPPNVSGDNSAVAAVATPAPASAEPDISQPNVPARPPLAATAIPARTSAAIPPRSSAPIPARTSAGRQSPAAAKVASTPAPSRPEISSAEAQTLLLNRLRTMRYYHVPPKCMTIDSVSFKNEGYTMSVRSASCKGDGKDSGALLGRWRVDAHTGESYVRNSSGHYVRP